MSGPFLRGQSSEYEKVLHGAYKIERKTHAHIQKLIHDIKKKKKEFPGGASGKEPTCNVGDKGSIPGSGVSPGERHGNPLQYSCLKNPHG